MPDSAALEKAVVEARKELADLMDLIVSALAVVADAPGGTTPDGALPNDASAPRATGPANLNQNTSGTGTLAAAAESTAGGAGAGTGETAGAGPDSGGVGSGALPVATAAAAAAAAAAGTAAVPETTATQHPGSMAAMSAAVPASGMPPGGRGDVIPEAAATVNGSASGGPNPLTNTNPSQNPSHDPVAVNALARADLSERLKNVRSATAAALEASSAYSADMAESENQISDDELAVMTCKRDDLKKTVAKENLKLKELIDHLRDLHRDVAILVDKRKPKQTQSVPLLTS